MSAEGQNFRVRFYKSDMKFLFHLEADLSSAGVRDADAAGAATGNKVAASSEHEKMAAGQGAEWCLVEGAGQRHALPIQSMTFLGREDCDVIVKSVSVDKRHAVLTFDPGKKKFKMKDLGSVNGTYVNDKRISEEEYIFLERQDKLRFGFDPMVYTMESSEVNSQKESVKKDVAPPVQDITAWAKRADTTQGMAECPGCIAEQDIQHICGSCQPDEVAVSSSSSFSVVSKELVHNGHPATGLPTSEQDKVTAGHAHTQWKEGPAICQEAVFTVTPPQERQDHVNLLFAHRPKLVNSHDPDTAEVKSLPGTYGVPGHDDDVLMRLGSTPAYTPCPHQVLQHSHCPCSHTHARAGYISAQPCFDAVTYIAPKGTVLHRHYVTGMTNVEYTERSELLRANEVLQSASGPCAVPVSYDVNKETHSSSTTSREQKFTDVGKISRDVSKITAQLSSPTAKPFEVKTYDTIKLSQFTTPAANIPCTVANQLNVNLDNARQAVKHAISDTKVSDKSDISFPTEVGSIREPPERDIPNQQRPAPGSPDAATSPDSPALARRDQRRSLTGRESDLKTVKKGTPLYGQPSWWGEEDSDQNAYTVTPSLSESKLLKDQENTVTQDKSSADRPNCLGLDKPVNGMDAKHTNDDRYGVNYMEIPYQDSRPQTIGDTRGSQTPPEKDTNAKSPEDGSVSAPGMAFTVDFSDTAKKLTMTDSISRFLPANVRRSFRDRKPKKLDKKGNSLDEDSFDKDKKQNGQMSPTRQKKIDTLFGVESPARRRKKIELSRPSGYHSDGHNSLSSDAEDLSIRSDTATTKSSTRSIQNKSTTRPAPPSGARCSPRNISQQPKGGSKTPSSTPRTARRSKQTTSRRSHDDVTAVETRTSADPTEFELYKEARTFNARAGPKPSDSLPSLSTRKSKAKTTKSEEHLCIPDNKSDTGTYTIDADNKDVSEARESIDKIFGVSLENSLEKIGGLMEKVVLEPGDDTDADGEELELDDSGRLERQRPQGSAADSMQVEVGSIISYNHCQDKSPTQSHFIAEDSPKWLNQWATSPDARPTAKTTPGTVHFTSPGANNEKKTFPDLSPGSARRSRTGSGRKLPTPPENRTSNIISSSPRSSIDHAIKEAERNEDNDSPGRHRATVIFDTDEGGVFTVSFDAPQRPKSAAKEDLKSATSQSKSSEMDSDTTENRTRSESVKSLDTEVLLQDTEYVVKAMTERVQQQSQRPESPDMTSRYFMPVKPDISDSDSSTGAVVEGDYNKNNYRCRRGRVNKDSFDSMETQKSPKSSRKVYLNETQKTSYKKSVKKPETSLGSPTRRRRSVRSGDSSGPPDGLSESEGPSESASIVSSSTEFSYCESLGSPPFSRKGSKGKGAITATRVNRAFALRSKKNAEANDSDTTRSDTSTLTPRSRPSSASHDLDRRSGSRSSGRSTERSRSGVRSSRSASRSRTSSAKNTSRTDNSEMSLGQKIVQKSRDNVRASSVGPIGFRRRDGGRHSMRSSNKTPTLPAQTTTSRPASAGKSADLKKSKTKTTQSTAKSRTSGLSVNGDASNRSHSPRTKEYAAWQKRKAYDPRRSVAEAKAKAKDTTSDRLQRSKSVGGSAEFEFRPRGDTTTSVSSLSSADSSLAFDDYGGRDRAGEIAQLSNAVASEMKALTNANESPSLQPEYTLAPSILSKDLSRSAFSIPNSTKSPSSRASSNSPHCPTSPPSLPCRTNHRTRSAGTVAGAGWRNNWPNKESYNSLLLSSIHELSCRVKSQTSALVQRLRESDQLSGSPSPEDDVSSPDPQTQNQELSAILRNLRKTESQLTAVEKGVFPRATVAASRELQKSHSERLRIQKENLFKPIEKPNAARSWMSQSSQDSDNKDPWGSDEYY